MGTIDQLLSRVALGTAAAALIGCAATTPTLDGSTAVPAIGAFVTAQPNSSTVQIFRDAAVTGGLYTYRVFVNGEPAAALRVAEHVVLQVPAGRAFIEVRGPLPPELLGQPASLLQEFNAGQRYYLRFSAGPVGHASLVPVPASAVGIKE